MAQHTFRDSAPDDELLSGFDPSLPVERAHTPPSTWYRSPSLLARELKQVFRRRWIAVGHAAQLRKPGDYITGTFDHEPWVVIRTTSGQLRAFYNVCRHHGACILNDRGNVDALVCPYHGWTYGLDGRLLKAPRIGAIKDFDRDAFGLRPIPVDTWAEMIVLHLGGQADQTPLHAELQPLQKRLEGFGIEGLTFHTRRRYTLACNWKVFVDNYLDGGYHVHTIHPGLAQELDTASYRTESWPTFSIQSSASSTQGHGDRMGSGALYAYVYPNLMINRYGPVMDINMVWPTGPEQCDVVFEYLFDEQAIGQEALDAFVAQCLDQSDLIQQEDVAICESVQRGLRSSAYTTGRYAPKLEHAMHRFHTQLASDLT